MCDIVALMDTTVAKGMIRVIRAEKKRRLTRLSDEDSEAAYDQWISFDELFVNELCLILLVAIRHQVERELVLLAACVTNDGKDLDRKQYQQNVKAEREGLKKNKKDGGGWEPLITKLKLESFTEWASSMETLRLLANCCKHDPSRKPDQKLLAHLKLKPANYMPLPESSCFQEGLAASVNLPNKADYCAIAEKLLNRAERFIADVQKQPMVSRVKWGRVSFSRELRGC